MGSRCSSSLLFIVNYVLELRRVSYQTNYQTKKVYQIENLISTFNTGTFIILVKVKMMLTVAILLFNLIYFEIINTLKSTCCMNSHERFEKLVYTIEIIN